jgi:ABC-2 type transport system ATP-binding protein
MTYAIRTNLLTKTFGEFTAVKNLNLNVKSGEIYGLLGPNGAGKTTTIKLLTGLLSITSGEGFVFDLKVPDKELAPDIGHMPQETALYTGITVHQNLEFFGLLYGLNNKQIKKREKELLKFVALERWRNKLVSNLSGGMKHRVSLACTLIHEPKLLFLDEPTVGVDPELRVSFWKYFQNLKSQGITILITTHYMDEARHCDRIGFMRRGELIAEGTPNKLLKISQTDSLEDAFLKFTKGGYKPGQKFGLGFGKGKEVREASKPGVGI